MFGDEEVGQSDECMLRLKRFDAGYEDKPTKEARPQLAQERKVLTASLPHSLPHFTAWVMKNSVWYAHSVDCIPHSALENVALLGKLVYQSTFSIYKPV